MSLFDPVVLRYFRNPLFILGTGRTGSTALKIALGQHPRIFTRSGEAPMVSHFGYLAFLISHHKQSRYYIKNTGILPKVMEGRLRWLILESVFGKNFGINYLIKVLVRKRILLSRTVWCCKIFPDQNEYLGLLTLFPNAKFIFLTRNGVSQIASHMARWPGENFKHYCLDWKESIERYSYALSNNNCLLVKHEDMVMDPDGVLNKIYKLCSLPFHEAPEVLLKTKSINTTKKTANEESIQEYLKNKKAPYEDWTDHERELFKEICGEGMRKLGYAMPF